MRNAQCPMRKKNEPRSTKPERRDPGANLQRAFGLWALTLANTTLLGWHALSLRRAWRASPPRPESAKGVPPLVHNRSFVVLSSLVIGPSALLSRAAKVFHRGEGGDGRTQAVVIAQQAAVAGEGRPRRRTGSEQPLPHGQQAVINHFRGAVQGQYFPPARFADAGPQRPQVE